MAVVLAENSYGKSRVRLVKVTRGDGRHLLQELALDIQFQGDFASAHTAGDNSKVLPTDTMKNTVYALAQGSTAEQCEEFGIELVEYFLKNNPQVSRARISLAEVLWNRMTVGGQPHGHAFIRAGDETRTTVVTGDREAMSVESGIEDLVVLKTTGSAFSGFIHDRYTTLKETEDRILATAVRAAWTYTTARNAFGAVWEDARRILLETFASHDSRSVQHTLYAMGEAVLKARPEISEIRLSLPNKHCLLVDLAAFGLENRNQIFQPVDEPHGLIEARLVRQSG